jgi:hypothetical protein
MRNAGITREMMDMRNTAHTNKLAAMRQDFALIR